MTNANILKVQSVNGVSSWASSNFWAILLGRSTGEDTVNGVVMLITMMVVNGDDDDDGDDDDYDDGTWRLGDVDGDVDGEW